MVRGWRRWFTPETAEEVEWRGKLAAAEIGMMGRHGPSAGVGDFEEFIESGDKGKSLRKRFLAAMDRAVDTDDRVEVFKHFMYVLMKGGNTQEVATRRLMKILESPEEY
ncbi:hypothetical protein LCGC14_2145500 [marine sediment metagenome]|uniref:Uncharacterized protein n=1 Tax=marine sediment metagenome TaxID=412755 RepID=A0A0F9DXC6_9ZZZZ